MTTPTDEKINIITDNKLNELVSLGKIENKQLLEIMAHVICGLSSHIYNPDALYLAEHSLKKKPDHLDIDNALYENIITCIFYFAKMKRKNPFKSMFE